MKMPKTSQLQKTLCHDCGRINIGYQTECLVCNGQLVASRKPGSKKTETIKDTEVTGDTGVVSSVCSSCGEQLASDQFFCTNCGTKKEEEVFPACESCGAGVEEDQLFCTACGKSLQ